MDAGQPPAVSGSLACTPSDSSAPKELVIATMTEKNAVQSAGQPPTVSGSPSRMPSGGGPSARGASSSSGNGGGSGSGQRSSGAPAATLGNWPSLVQTLSTRSSDPLEDRGTASAHASGATAHASGASTPSAGPAVHAGLPAGAFAGSSTAGSTSGTPQLAPEADGGKGANFTWCVPSPPQLAGPLHRDRDEDSACCYVLSHPSRARLCFCAVQATVSGKA
jgi:hypothetical protein